MIFRVGVDLATNKVTPDPRGLPHSWRISYRYAFYHIPVTSPGVQLPVLRFLERYIAREQRGWTCTSGRRQRGEGPF